MTGSMAVKAIGTRRGVLIMTMALLSVLLLGPSGASGAKTLAECTDETWAGYNDCLVNARSFIGRIKCDLSWELEVAECIAQEVGEVRRAFDGETNVPN